MSNKSRKQASLKLIQARRTLAEARTTNDPRQISVAVANLGLALFKVNKFKEGAQSFYEVDRIFKELDDFNLHVHCLSIRSIAYQLSEQYPQAFQTAQEIETLATANAALGTQSDALATQGQILIDSGEEVFALEKFNAALEIAEKLDDKRRIMNVTGALGNYCMTIASPKQAEAYFEKARELARALRDRQSEIGFHGNLGALLEWQEKYQQAGDIFEEVLVFVRESGNQEAVVQALRRLIRVHTKLKDPDQIINYAQQGMKATKESGNSDDFYFFYEILTPVLYEQNLLDEAHQAAKDAIDMAQSENDINKQVNLLLNLGESYMVTDKPEEALETFQQSLAGTQRLQRMVDRGYVLGRMGMILAELGRTDEALTYHEQAIELARKHENLELEGEQLAMLAMGYFEKGELDRARSLGETAVTVYTKAGLHENADKARNLLAAMDRN